MQFDTFGFTAGELARKQAEKEQQQRLDVNYMFLVIIHIMESNFQLMLIYLLIMLTCKSLKLVIPGVKINSDGTCNFEYV